MGKAIRLLSLESSIVMLGFTSSCNMRIQTLDKERMSRCESEVLVVQEVTPDKTANVGDDETGTVVSGNFDFGEDPPANRLSGLC